MDDPPVCVFLCCKCVYMGKRERNTKWKKYFNKHIWEMIVGSNSVAHFLS